MLQKVTSYAALALTAFALSAGTASAQQLAEDQDWCRGRDYDRDHDRYCEVREFTLGAMDRITVDAAPNGGIKVEGWDRNEIRVLARVSGQADDMDDARALVQEVEVLTGRTISSDHRAHDLVRRPAHGAARIVVGELSHLRPP
jgi:hypothetical protein